MACSPDDVACAVRDLAAAVRAAAAPSFDWIAALGVVASVGIGLAALLTSRRATQIAEQQRRTAYDSALDGALADMFAAIERYTTAMTDWVRFEERHAKDSAKSADAVARALAGARRPPRPRPAAVSILWQAARLRTRAKDATTMLDFGRRMNEIFESKPEEQSGMLGDLVRDIVDWRISSLPRADQAQRGQ